MRRRSTTEVVTLGQGVLWIAAGLWPLSRGRNWGTRTLGALMTLFGGSLVLAVVRRGRAPLPPWQQVGPEDVWRDTGRPSGRGAARVSWPHGWVPVGQWDIAPGETLLPEGRRDLVSEASMESFPASDPPAYWPGRRHRES